MYLNIHEFSKSAVLLIATSVAFGFNSGVQICHLETLEFAKIEHEAHAALAMGLDLSSCTLKN